MSSSEDIMLLAVIVLFLIVSECSEEADKTADVFMWVNDECSRVNEDPSSLYKRYPGSLQKC